MTFKKNYIFQYSSKNFITNRHKSQGDMSAKKTCSTCKKQKGCTFKKRRKSKDGLQHNCTDCQRTHKQSNWASRIVHGSINSDKDMHRPIDGDDYIDKQWVQELVNANPNCHYCDVTLVYGIGINRCTHPDGLQLDRMDSALPHLKSNCVQCCRTCNVRGNNKPYKQKIEIVIKIFL